MLHAYKLVIRVVGRPNVDRACLLWKQVSLIFFPSYAWLKCALSGISGYVLQVVQLY